MVWHHGLVRVLIAPGSFGPELPAVQAATAIASGWGRQAPGDDLLLAPLSDAGAGYVDVLQHSLGGHLFAVTVSDVQGRPTPASILVVGDCAYVEAAHAVGVGLTPPADPERATSLGLGQLIVEAVRTGAAQVVVGVGARGVASNDGGAGLLAGLGAVSEPLGALLAGSTEMDTLLDVHLDGVRALVRSTALVLATDDNAPLLGLLGTTNTAGGRRGLTAEQIPRIDARLEHLGDLVGRRTALVPGSGAGGGLGFALLVAGATRAPGLKTVMDAISLAASASRSDLVVTGEDAFDLSVGSGEVVTGVATVAGSAVRPCIVLANRLAVGGREARALGIESAYSVADLAPGEAATSPVDRLAAAAARVARTWSWSH